MSNKIIDHHSILLEEIKCPYCQTTQKEHHIVRSWKYSNSIVTRFECKCGTDFNFYKSNKSQWTIPKNPKKKLVMKKENVK